MDKAWIDKIHEANEILDHTAGLLLKSAIAFRQTGNEFMHETLKLHASEIIDAALAIGNACSDKLSCDLKNTQSQSNSILAAVLAGIKIANKEKVTIIVEVKNGVVWDVKNIPPGIAVEVRDFDCDEEANKSNEIEIVDGKECWVDHYIGD